MEYDIQINNGVEAFGTAGQKTITVNESVKTVDAKFLAHYISLHNPTIPQQTAESVLANFVECSAELMAQGNAIQLKNGQDVAMRLYPDIHIKGGNINLERARQLDPSVTEITTENATQLVQKAGVTVRAYAEVEQKFTDLLLAQGASVTASGKITEKAAVQRTNGSGTSSSEQEQQPSSSAPVLTVAKTGTGTMTLTDQTGHQIESGAAVTAGQTLTIAVTPAGSATPTATIGSQTVTLTEDEGQWVGTFQMPAASATLAVRTGGTGDNEE